LKNHSIYLDIKIIIKTILTIFVYKNISHWVFLKLKGNSRDKLRIWSTWFFLIKFKIKLIFLFNILNL
jgi:hypothetical protein